MSLEIFKGRSLMFPGVKALGHFKWQLKPESDSGFILVPAFQSPSILVPIRTKIFPKPPRERGDKRISVLSQLAAGVILFDLQAFQQNKRPFLFFDNLCSL